MAAASVALLSAFLVGSLLVVYIVAVDRKRFLVQFDLASWRDHQYLRRLPNFLQALHDRRFRSAWPRRANAISSALFCHKASKVLRATPAANRISFMRQHVTLFALLEQLRPYIDDFLLHERQRIVSQRLAEMSDTVDRDRLAAYFDSICLHRARFYRTITAYDRKIMVTMIDRRFIPTLRIAHAVFQEHGFSLLPDFNTLRLWETLQGTDLAQELPRNFKAIKRLPAASALKTFNYGEISPSDDYPVR